MKTLLFAVALTATFISARAEVLVYNQKITRTMIGGGQTVRTSLSGWLIIDATSNVWSQVAFVNIDTKRGHFNVEYPNTWNVNSVGFGLNKLDTVISKTGQGIGGIIASGADSTIDVGSEVNYLWVLPKTMKVSGNDSYTTTDNYLVTYAGTLTFDKSDTWYANFSPPIPFGDVVAAAVNNLINHGYIQDP
jgi:hypothetical protein